jgi:hypothetical protein
MLTQVLHIIMISLHWFLFLTDGKAHVAFYLPVYREAVSRNHRASCSGSKCPPQYLQLHKGGHGSTGQFVLQCPSCTLSRITMKL